MRLISIAAFVAALSLPAAVVAAPVTYHLDGGHTLVLASWNHKGLSNPTAMFSDIEGTLVYDPEQPTAARVEATIPLASIHTGSEKLNAHLKSDDFFAADAFPVATFESTSVKTGADDKRLIVEGKLTVHGVTKPVTLDVHLNAIRDGEKPAIAFDARTTLSRSAFGVDRYVPYIGDEIAIRITTEAYPPEPENDGKSDS